MEFLLKDQSQFLDLILNTTEEIIIVVDSHLIVRYMNDAAKMILHIEEESYKGRHFYKDFHWDIPDQSGKSQLEMILETGVSITNVVRQTTDGKHLSFNAFPLIENGKSQGVLITARDISKFVEMEQELDMAFALTLPNSKVEHKLKTLVEYQDTYDPDTRMITVTGVIKDGGYRHVVNCLKLFSMLHEQGITKIIGIDKDTLVSAFVFHDLGKSQPQLSIGEVVDPKVAFEDGKLHAYRGAEIAKNFYGQDDEVVEIIRYHHHHEDALPETFPWRVLPMFRLFQLIDGLSAAVTRGEVKVEFSVHDCVVEVTEENHRPQYNGTRQIDLYTGERKQLK